MNSIPVNHSTQISHISHTLIQPVIPGTKLHIETSEERTIQHYDKLIIAIMKIINIQYITHLTDNQYWLIIIHGAGDTLIYIVSSKILTKHLLKQKGKQNSIKTGVYCIKQLTILPNGTYHYDFKPNQQMNHNKLIRRRSK